MSFCLFPSSLLFLQVDNRPCSRLPSTCFPFATEAASFLRAVMLMKPSTFPALSELKAIISIRGVREEVGSREEEVEVKGRRCHFLSSTGTRPASSFIQTKLCATTGCYFFRPETEFVPLNQKVCTIRRK